MFFNDGDNKGDDKKVISKTGGIYTVFTNKYVMKLKRSDYYRKLEKREWMATKPENANMKPYSKVSRILR